MASDLKLRENGFGGDVINVCSLERTLVSSLELESNLEVGLTVRDEGICFKKNLILNYILVKQQYFIESF